MMLMFNDEEVVNMISKHGFVTMLNFFVYGQLSLTDADMLSMGVVPKMLLLVEENHPFVILVDYVDEDTARALNIFQGTKVTFIFGGRVPHQEEIAEHIGEGISFLRFKYDFLGFGKCEDGV